jgi:subtilisin family serine protease
MSGAVGRLEPTCPKSKGAVRVGRPGDWDEGMMRKSFALIVAVWLMGTGRSFAADLEPPRYLLRLAKESTRDRVYKTHGLTEVKNIGWLYNLHVVTGPAGVDPATLVAKVLGDRNVRTFEPDYVASTGEMAAAHPDLKQTTETLEQALAVDRTAIDFEGALAWTGYVHQPALDKIEVEAAREAGQKGEGLIVAVIDSGIDPDHPVLKDVLLPGYDFTRNQPGASEWLDLDPTTASVLTSDDCSNLTQSTSAIMDQSTSAIMDQSTSAIMDECNAAVVTQSTSAIMDSDTVQQLAAAPLPADFGHGTMVAGLIHAVAPKARILPIKAFRADGTGRASDIAQAVYYAYLSGARIINMSFTFPVKSQEVMYATAFAALAGAIPVAAAGNQGLTTQRWPAEHKWVLGVGSTTPWDARSSFSNQGYDTFKIGAPGENLITTYPGNHYASVSGTSFSAALVSGSVALMGKAAPLLEWGATRDVVYKGSYAAISNVVRDAANNYPQRLIVPPAVELAPILQRDDVKQINNLK